MSEWKTYKLGEIAEIKNGKSRPKEAGNIPVYGGNGILDYTNKFNTQNETIIIGRVGAYCGSVFFEDDPLWISDNAMFAKSKHNTSSKFLYYLLKEKNLNKYAQGSSHPLLTQGFLNDLEITVPDLPTQTQIAQILTSLDDKIELNLQMNQTLEAMAQAIFKEWFVDFKFPGFDGELVEGLPKGWRMGSISEIMYVQNGYAFKSNDFTDEGNNGIIKIKNISNNVVDIVNMQFVPDEVALKIDKRFKVESGDLLIAMTGAEVGKVGIVPKTEKDLWLNQRVGSFKEKVKYSKWFCYLILSTNEYQNILLSSASGSAQPNISGSQIERTEIILPSISLIEEFGSIVNSLFEKILENYSFNQTLTQTRDTLLPELMSGKISLNCD